MKVLHLDSNHPVLIDLLAEKGFENTVDCTSTRTEILKIISSYEGLILRSRIKIDKEILTRATSLKFIGRVGAGLENIDLEAAKRAGIVCYNAPEGNSNAVGEHALGMLLCLFNKLHLAHASVRNKNWKRELHRGIELKGKTVGIIGYGNMGKSFAKKLSAMECTVLCHDILPDLGDQYAQQVSLKELQKYSDVVSLHTPQTSYTSGMINANFINAMKKPFYLINTARGSAVDTRALLEGLEKEKVLGAGLDVLEYEASSFESIFEPTLQSAESSTAPKGILEKLLKSEKVLLSPHVAGWTRESHIGLAQTIAKKIIADFEGAVR